MESTKTNEMYCVVAHHTYKTSDLKDTFNIIRDWILPTKEQCYEYVRYWGIKHGAIDTHIEAEGTPEQVRQYFVDKGIIDEEAKE